MHSIHIYCIAGKGKRAHSHGGPYGRVCLEVASRHVFFLDSFLVENFKTSPVDSFLLWAKNNIMSKSGFEWNVLFFGLKIVT